LCHTDITKTTAPKSEILGRWIGCDTSVDKPIAIKIVVITQDPVRDMQALFLPN